MERHEEMMKGIQLLFNSHPQEAEKLFKEKKQNDPMFSLGFSLTKFLEAALSFSKQGIEEGLERLSETHKQASPTCSSSSQALLSSLLFSPPLSPASVHSDLIMADSLAMSSLLLLLQESYLAYMKAALQLRTSHGLYTQAARFLEEGKGKGKEEGKEKEKEKEKEDPLDLEDGVDFGLGLFSLTISLLPEKVVSVAEYFGFKGERGAAVEKLKKCHERGGMRSPLASLLLLTFHLPLGSFFCLPDADLQQAEEVLALSLQRFPRGPLFLWMAGKAHRVAGNFSLALNRFAEAIEVQRQADLEAKMGFLFSLFFFPCFLLFLFSPEFCLQGERGRGTAMVLAKHSYSYASTKWDGVRCLHPTTNRGRFIS